jgi:hypothetical protein
LCKILFVSDEVARRNKSQSLYNVLYLSVFQVFAVKRKAGNSFVLKTAFDALGELPMHLLSLILLTKNPSGRILETNQNETHAISIVKSFDVVPIKDNQH